MMWRLYASMIISILIVTGASLLILWAISPLIGGVSIESLIVMVAIIYLVQWLISPYIIDAMYHVEPYDDRAPSWLKEAVDRISRESGVKRPRLMIADLDVPNAFAYGNIVAGYRVAVTRGLLRILEPKEVEAVIGHEIGHLKHKDVIVMMMIGLLPAILWWLGNILMRWGWFYGFGRRDENDLSPIAIMAIGVGLTIVAFILNLGVLYLSRLREYYADMHSALTVKNGAYYLQRALVKILAATGKITDRMKSQIAKASQLKMLLIADPENAINVSTHDIDYLIEYIKSIKPSLLEELFSSHPHPSKRLKFLDKFRNI
ncbi:MAG: zinc metalloprotease HtpX [Crenarchaeota archaeon]|nr:zinc metalloprotease HtpX [Thermoproteota archaeon]